MTRTVDEKNNASAGKDPHKYASSANDPQQYASANDPQKPAGDYASANDPARYAVSDLPAYAADHLVRKRKATGDVADKEAGMTAVKRKKNREAAQRCRRKKEQETEDLRQKIEELENDNCEMAKQRNESVQKCLSLEKKCLSLEKTLRWHQDQGCTISALSCCSSDPDNVLDPDNTLDPNICLHVAYMECVTKAKNSASVNQHLQRSVLSSTAVSASSSSASQPQQACPASQGPSQEVLPGLLSDGDHCINSHVKPPPQDNQQSDMFKILDNDLCGLDMDEKCVLAKISELLEGGPEAVRGGVADIPACADIMSATSSDAKVSSGQISSDDHGKLTIAVTEETTTWTLDQTSAQPSRCGLGELAPQGTAGDRDMPAQTGQAILYTASPADPASLCLSRKTAGTVPIPFPMDEPQVLMSVSTNPGFGGGEVSEFDQPLSDSFTGMNTVKLRPKAKQLIASTSGSGSRGYRMVSAEQVARPQQVVSAQQMTCRQQAVSAQQMTWPQQAVSAQQMTWPQQVVSAQQMTCPQQVVSAQQMTCPQQAVSAQQMTCPQQVVSAQQMTCPQQAISAQQMTCPQQVVSAQQMTCPQQAVSAQQMTCPQQVVSAQQMTCPQQAVSAQQMTWPQQAVSAQRTATSSWSYPHNGVTWAQATTDCSGRLQDSRIIKPSATAGFQQALLGLPSPDQSISTRDDEGLWLQIQQQSMTPGHQQQQVQQRQAWSTSVSPVQQQQVRQRHECPMSVAPFQQQQVQQSQAWSTSVTPVHQQLQVGQRQAWSTSVTPVQQQQQVQQRQAWSTSVTPVQQQQVQQRQAWSTSVTPVQQQQVRQRQAWSTSVTPVQQQQVRQRQGWSTSVSPVQQQLRVQQHQTWLTPPAPVPQCSRPQAAQSLAVQLGKPPSVQVREFPNGVLETNSTRDIREYLQKNAFEMLEDIA